MTAPLECARVVVESASRWDSYHQSRHGPRAHPPMIRRAGSLIARNRRPTWAFYNVKSALREGSHVSRTSCRAGGLGSGSAPPKATSIDVTVPTQRGRQGLGAVHRPRHRRETQPDTDRPVAL